MSIFNSSQTVSKWQSAGDQRAKVRGIPNFFSSQQLGRTPQITSAAQFLVVAAVGACVLRVFSRRRTKTRFGLDDMCAVLAAFFLLANELVFMGVSHLGFTSFSPLGKVSQGKELERQGKIVLGLKLSLAFEVIYLISIFLVKFSLLFVYDRFARQTRGITLYLRITQGVCAITFATCILSLFLSCIPIRDFWSIETKSHQCTRRTLLTYTSGISNIVTNILVLAVPVPLLLRASLSRRQKVGLVILYFFGAFVILGSALRFVTQLLSVSLPQAMGWSQLEVSLALLLACAPMATKLLLLPLVDPKVERERITKRGKPGGGVARGRGGEEGEDTPTFMKRLMSEKDAYMNSQQQQQQRAESTISSNNPPKRPRVVSFAADTKGEAPSSRALRVDTSVGYAERRSKDSPGTGSSSIVRGIESPDYQNLTLERREVNGQSVWEVRPLSPRLAV